MENHSIFYCILQKYNKIYKKIKELKSQKDCTKLAIKYPLKLSTFSAYISDSHLANIINKVLKQKKLSGII